MNSWGAMLRRIWLVNTNSPIHIKPSHQKNHLLKWRWEWMNEWMNTNMKEADNRIWKTWNPSHVQNDQNLVPLRNSSVSSLWMMVNVESRIGSFTRVWIIIWLLKSQSAICIHEGPMILQFQEEKMVSNSILCFFFMNFMLYVLPHCFLFTSKFTLLI